MNETDSFVVDDRINGRVGVAADWGEGGSFSYSR